METPTKSIHVNIFGEEYPLRSQGGTDVEYMNRVAGYVDSSMKKIAERSPHLATGKIAILAALNITDELLSAKKTGVRRELDDMKQRARRLQARLEKCLDADTPSTARSPLS